MAEINLTHAGSLKSGSYLLIDGKPFIVKSTQTSRPGKHGHAKVRIKATDMFTGSTKEIVKPGHDSVEVPLIYKKKGQILSINNNDIEIMDMETFENVTADMNYVDDEIKSLIAAGQTIMYWLIMDKVLIKQIMEESE